METGTANPLATSRVMTGPVDIRTAKIAADAVRIDPTGNTAAVVTAATVLRAAMDFARTAIIPIGTVNRPRAGAILIVPRIGIGIPQLPGGPAVLGSK